MIATMPQPQPPSQGARILVADDDVNVRLLSRQCLQAEGMQVIEAADGAQCP